MLATEILTKDHKQALALIETLEDATDGTGSYADSFNQLEAALQLHMREEEEVFYPALAQYEEFSDIMDELVPEHEMVKQMLAQMGELAPSSDEFQDLLAQMKTALEAHMTEEEDDIFPESIEVLGADTIEQLGEEIETIKNEGGMGRAVNM
ncbi:MAG TPA: hemerythrin domain-containing protein [Pyrinomonadaceae bacterium]|jgi:iron-sulfur cluster repair protein YtfE (RIC family)